MVSRSNESTSTRAELGLRGSYIVSLSIKGGKGALTGVDRQDEWLAGPGPCRIRREVVSCLVGSAFKLTTRVLGAKTS